MMLRNALFALLLTSTLLMAAPKASPKQDPPEKLPAGKPIDWYHFADFSTKPNMQLANRLADGNLKTGSLWVLGTEAPGTLFFRFPKPIQVEAFRCMQNGLTKAQILADMDGSGTFKTLLAEYKTAKPENKKPITFTIQKKGVHGLKFQALTGQAGFRYPFPTFSEIEIYSKDTISVPHRKLSKAPVLTPQKELQLPPVTKRNVDVRVCTDTWSYGIIPSNYASKDKQKPAKPIKSFKNHKGILGVVKFLRDTDANSVRLFIESPCCSDSMPWKSDLWKGYGDDYLKGMTSELKKHGIKLYFFSHAWMSPFQKRFQRGPMPWCRWDYPYEASDRHEAYTDFFKVKYPCTLGDDHFRKTWTQFLCEALEQGAAGVYLMPDEWYYKGHFLNQINCPGCTKAFKDMYGYDAPPKVEANTEQYRKWKLYEYRRLAQIFDETARVIRKKFPKAQIVRSDCCIGNATRGRMETTTAVDYLWEHRDLADFAQMYAANTPQREINFVKEYEGATGKDKMLGSVQWLNVWNKPVDYSIQLIAPVMADVMLGAKVIEHYRQSYIIYRGWTPNFVLCNRMIRLLESWDVDRTSVPNHVCLFLSRASEDWWSLKERTSVSKPNAKTAFYLHLAGTDINKCKEQLNENPQDRRHIQDATRGQGAKMAISNLLVDYGIPYHVRYAEMPQTLKDLPSFKLILIPLAYALSDQACQALEQAATKGSRIIIFDQLAPADELGNLRKEPALKGLAKHPNVTFLNESPAGLDGNRSKAQQYLALFSQTLGKEGFAFAPQDNQVTYLMTQYNDRNGWLLLLGNWSDSKDATVAVSLPATPQDLYQAQAFSSKTQKLNAMAIQGRTGLRDKDLKDFQVTLKPAEVKLVRIRK